MTTKKSERMALRESANHLESTPVVYLLLPLRLCHSPTLAVESLFLSGLPGSPAIGFHPDPLPGLYQGFAAKPAMEKPLLITPTAISGPKILPKLQKPTHCLPACLPAICPNFRGFVWNGKTANKNNQTSPSLYHDCLPICCYLFSTRG
jgi:hypothetical protein